MHRSIELEVDVEEAAGVPGARLRVTGWLPEVVADPPVVCFAFPGGGYNRRYWSFDLPGSTGDGEAGYHAERGWIVLAVDHLGVGDSTVPEGPLSMETVAAANHAAVGQLVARLARGELAEGLGPLAQPVTLGFGQSMGGQFLLVLQAHHRPFDGIAVLGYSALHTVVPTRPGAAEIPFPWIVRATAGPAPVIVNAHHLSEVVLRPPGAENPLQWAFHYDDEPPEVVAADMAAEPLAPWRSATAPECAVLGVAPGVVATEAASISVPVFLGVGERDVVPNPWLEPLAYKTATDLTLMVVPRMAHMHNFASTRRQLWARLQHWGDGVALASR